MNSDIDFTAYEKFYDGKVGPATPHQSPKRTRSPPKSPPPKKSKGKKTKSKRKKHKKTKRKARGLVNEQFMNSLNRPFSNIGNAEQEINNSIDKLLSELSTEELNNLILKLPEKDKAELLDILNDKLSK